MEVNCSNFLRVRKSKTIHVEKHRDVSVNILVTCSIVDALMIWSTIFQLNDRWNNLRAFVKRKHCLFHFSDPDLLKLWKIFVTRDGERPVLRRNWDKTDAVLRWKSPFTAKRWWKKKMVVMMMRCPEHDDIKDIISVWQRTGASEGKAKSSWFSCHPII